jgi:succinoglycan biosynthesis protein ExoW
LSKLRTCVLIPYFQRKPGILRASVSSALRQQGVEDFFILIVDDGSPIPAKTELQAELERYPERILLLEQENRGNPNALNLGLDNLPQDVQYVAFLDSDDEWSPHHLARAVAALERQYDFYFADFYQLGQTVTAFNRAARILVESHPPIDDLAPLREYQGNMFDQVITGNVLGMSTTAFAYRRMPHVRFREDFTHTGMEYLFWLDVALQARRIAFSPEPECRYGAGVNIFSNPEWGTEKFLRVICDEVKYRKAILHGYPVTNSQKEFLKGRLEVLRNDFVLGVLNQLRQNRRPPAWHTLIRYLRQDAALLLLFWPLAARTLATKVARGLRPD